EDTNTDYDDLHERFGKDVADWVAALSKDKRLLDGPREEEYRAGLAAAPWQVKVCNLADIFDNLLDSRHVQPEQRARSFRRSREYLNALQTQLPEQARRPFDLVTQLLAEREADTTS